MSKVQLMLAADLARGLAPLDKVVLQTLANWSDQYGRCLAKKVAAIAEASEVSPRSVTTALARLADKGFIDLRPGRGAGKLNDIQLTIERGHQRHKSDPPAIGKQQNVRVSRVQRLPVSPEKHANFTRQSCAVRDS